MAYIKKHGREVKRIKFNFSMAKDESKYLKEIMNSRLFKLLRGHVIADEAMFLSVIAYLNLSQARPSLLKRVIGPLSRSPIGEGLDSSAPRRGRESSTLETVGLATGAAGSRTTTRVMDDVRESNFCFLLP